MIAISDYSADILKGIYTTNAIQSLNRGDTNVGKKRKLFLRGDAGLKVIFLAINSASKIGHTHKELKVCIKSLYDKYKEQLTPHI